MTRTLGMFRSGHSELNIKISFQSALIGLFVLIKSYFHGVWDFSQEADSQATTISVSFTTTFVAMVKKEDMVPLKLKMGGNNFRKEVEESVMNPVSTSFSAHQSVLVFVPHEG